MTKRLIEKALQSEMNNHLGYDKYSRADNDNARNGITSKKLISEHGAVEIEVPRDRHNTFEPEYYQNAKNVLMVLTTKYYHYMLKA
ncbi:MAG: hypothetical protein DMENIID0002_12380 [Rickettsia endosymbiont of Sergentomyia squamirostris]|uniref:Mutator family transposase n=1 Tax=Candidatus Tisiphia endosymbiont of Sergentomyia squamirostris TaxID=3113639 RepID=A0AAT9G9Y8_9RICK